MIIGYVLDLTPRVRLSVRGVSSPIAVDFVIDTGFEGELALPVSIVSRLNASCVGIKTIQLADGSYRKAQRYDAMLDWNGESREVQILEFPGGTPLLGVELLADNLVTLDMSEGGEVIIEPR